MSNCDICYSPIQNNVTLECKHSFCLKCIVNYLRVNDICLSCPMCRRSYQDIYFKKTQEDILDTSLELDLEIYHLPYHDLMNLLLDQNPDKRINYYRTHISHGNIACLDIFLIAERNSIDLILEQQLLERFLLQALANDIPFKEQTLKHGQFELTNSQTYLQDYYDILVLVLREA